jgi:hypothetical protein
MSTLKVGTIIPNSGTKVNITGSTLLVTTASGHFSGSYSGDGSGLDGTGGLPFTGSGTVSGSLLVTGSSTLALRVSGSTALTGSLFVSGTISGSFIGNGSGITSVSSISSSTSVLAQTASVATRANALAPTVTATSSSTAIIAQTASVAVRATTLSAQATASFADVAGTVHDGNITAAKIATDAVITAKILNSNVTNAKLANDSVTIGSTEIDLGATTATLTGLTSISAITASFVLQTFESSSTVITSGSNIFGDKANDIQQITGSLLQTGSAVISGSLDVAQGTISGSFRGDGSNLTGISSYTVANSTNNRVLTSVDASNGNAEANLTFDGSTLTVTGLVSSTSGSIGDLTVTRITETSALIHKENVQTLGDVDSIFNLRPVSFNWKEDNREDIGLIAGEVQEHYPQLVKNDHEGNALGINYSKLTAILIKAVQDLSTRITNLENK